MTEEQTHVIQVTNISPNISEEQIKHFLEYIGRIREIKLYPEVDGDANQTKVAYGRYDSADHVEVALHLTNTVMVDRALILVPYPDETLPDETRALRVAAPMSAVAGMLPPTLDWPSNVVNMICGSGSSQTIHTIDPKLIELGLQQYPNLPGKTDPSKVEEIRRTIYVSNLDPEVNAEQLVQFFSKAGEVMYVRMAGDENLPSRNAYLEFSNQKSVPVALAYNGVNMSNRHLKVSHSLSSVSDKPQTEAQVQLSKEIDESMKKFKDIEHLIHGGSKSSRRPRSRSRSKERRRHKSKERRRSRERRRSPSPRKSSRRSSRPSAKKEGDESSKSSSTKDRDRDRKRRSRSRERKRSRSRDRERRRSRSRDKKRSRSRERKRSRSREKKRSRSRDRRRDRSRDRKRRSRSRDRSRRSRSRDRDSKKSRSKRSSSKDRDRRKRREETSKSNEKELKNGVKVTRDYDAEEKSIADVDDNEANKAAEQNGEKEAEEKRPNGEKEAVDSDSDPDTKSNDASISSSSKTKNAMAELERQADTEAMDMDTGDDSDTAA